MVRRPDGIRLLALLAGAAAALILVTGNRKAGFCDETSGGVSAAPREAHPLDPALQMARDGLDHIRREIDDYEALIVKRERVNGTLQDPQTMEVKIRNRKMSGETTQIPLGVYLKFLSPQSVKGREVIWVEGANAGKLIAHEGGLKNLLRVELEPTGFLAMLGQRYPITEIGFENLVVKLIEKGERDRKQGQCEVKFFKQVKVGQRPCTMIQVVHPVQKPHLDFYRARIFIDDGLGVPVRYAAWTWPEKEGDDPLLLEEYTYLNVKLNVGLSDEDFDPDHRNYDFP